MMHQNLWREQGEPAETPQETVHRSIVDHLQHRHNFWGAGRLHFIPWLNYSHCTL
jgi:hypothetical protein